MPKLLKSFVLIFAFAVAAMAQIQLPVTQAARTPSPNAPSGSCFTQTLPVYDYVLAKYWYCVPNTTPPLNLGTWTNYSLPTGILSINATGQVTTATGAQVAASATTSGTGTTLCLTVGCALTLTNATAPPPALIHLNVEKALALTDLQTLNSVPYQVIAPPGATSMIQMGSCTLNLTRGSAAFTGGGTVSIGYDTTSSPATNGTIASTVFTTFAASHAVVVLPVAVAVTATTGLANKGIYITATGGDFASGTGATGQLNCDYSVVTGVQ